MRHTQRAFLSLALVAFAICCTPDAGAGIRHRDAGPVDAAGGHPHGSYADADHDGISDTAEDRSTGVDTDGDGMPDYLDLDSDGDTIPDMIEGGVDAAGNPRDADGDGKPDFRDLDSDGNGIRDRDEGADDPDGDGTPNSSDLDDDGDALPDVLEIEDPTNPTDFDADGIPDFRDLDSDNDTIADKDEMDIDTDSDATKDRHDLDSDNDTISDADEAGDTDLMTPPIDSDFDFIADFRDPDSDDDGVSDADEITHGTNPRNADTDGDGVPDLVEISGCPPGDPTCTSDATDSTSSPRTRGNFVFLEPYMMPPTPTMDTLKFSTNLQVADVYFLMDTTGSMSSPISALQAGLSTPTTGLIDRVRTVIPDVWFGVGEHKDYPCGSYGGSGDWAYLNRQSMTMDATAAQHAVSLMSAGGGNDGPEAQIPALWSIATGAGLPGMSASTSPSHCPDGTHGYPCFRPGAVPIVVLITDVVFHNGPGGTNSYSDAVIGAHAPTYSEALAALRANNVRVIGINVGGGATNEAQLAMDTGAVNASGAPLVSTFAYTDHAIGDVVLHQIQTLANQTPVDVSLSYEDDATDAVDTKMAFVDHIAANTAGDAARGCDPHMADDTDGDGVLDTFRQVTPGSPVCFDIFVKQNDTVMQTPMPQLFKATLHVLGDGFTELDHRVIYFLVPPHVTIDIPG